MIISKAHKSELKEILDLQYIAYRSEAEIYNDNNIQPLTQNIEELEQEYENHIILKAVIDDIIVGSIRAIEDTGICKVSKLIVNPNYQNQGIGTKLMECIEYMFNHTKRFELFTGHKSVRNLYLYNKLGYKTYRMEVISKNLTLIYMYKE
ncbi:GNAT family N-acetyltransferase [Paenibacillus sp. IHBB 10380]|uniref:GNAT family N-acetyltransferase n=1 Tax=Paenibacillus sp. IHBB 10380 TaxID=1566358 RepID=UPI0005CFBBB6|nr:GNAT family N-acetyltransferase [Paenibacillus sp. IHBB 10380]AJS58853.1 hypothetical protein UB51_10615 [Paenibacillus sp. IHBB 10380]